MIKSDMETGLLIFILMAGCLFVLKMFYVLCTASVLSQTKGALYVSTSTTRISAFLDAVPMSSGQLLVDLGCGDGRVLRKASRRYQVKGVGYELNLLAYMKAKLFCLGQRDIQVKWGNFMYQDLSCADIVFCYLFPDVMKQLAAKLYSDLKTGAVIVSCNFSLPGFRPDQIIRPRHPLHNEPIFIYRINRNVHPGTNSN